jgi:hypothetical protein
MASSVAPMVKWWPDALLHRTDAAAQRSIPRVPVPPSADRTCRSTYLAPSPRSVRSFLERVQSAFCATWRVRSGATWCSSVRSFQATPNALLQPPPHAPPARPVTTSCQRLVEERHCPFYAVMTGLTRPAFGHNAARVWSIKNTFFWSPTLPPLIKCSNHQVFHFVHVR